MLIHLASPTVTASPGEPVALAASVTNTEDREVSATLRIHGVPTEGTGFSALQLRPGEQVTVEFELVMPIGSPGGTHPFQVEVVTDAGPAAAARGEVVVRDSDLIHLSLTPNGISGKRRGELMVGIHNRSRQAAQLRLSGKGDDHRIRFRFEHREVEVHPGERVNVRTKVRSRRPLAGEHEFRRFTVRAHGAAVPLRARGTFRQTAVFSPNLSKAMAVLVVLGLVASAVVTVAAITNRDDILSAIGIRDSTADDGDAGSTDAGGEPGASAGDGEGSSDGGGGDGGGAGGAEEPEETPANPGGAPRVTGFVRDPEGNGLPTVDVSLSPASLGSRASTIAVEAASVSTGGKRLGPIAPDRRQAVRARGSTGDDGTYAVPISAAGPYYLEFRSAGYQTARHLVVFDQDLAPIGLDVTMQPAQGRITGSVSPATGARVFVGDGGSRYETIADADTGRWEVTGVSVPGQYVVSAALPTGESEGIVVSIPASAAERAFDVGSITLTSGMTSLSGVVCDGASPSGDGIPGATVSVATGGEEPGFTTTTADGDVTEGGVVGAGAFVLNGLPLQDSYDVTVAAPGYVTATARSTGTAFEDDCITLTPATGGLVGTVEFDDPGPNTSGISVQAVSAANTYSTTVGEQGDDGRGRFAIDGMEPGQYVVTVSRPDTTTVVNLVQIVPPEVTELTVVVEQSDTDASLSAPVRILQPRVADDRGLRTSAPAPEQLTNIRVTVPGVDLGDRLTNAVAADGTIDEVVQLPLGHHRIQISADGHETVRLPFTVRSLDEATVNLIALPRPGSDPLEPFDGELRPLASLETRFVSGLGAGTPNEAPLDATAVLRKVLAPTSDEPARGLDEYGPVDPGTTNTITMDAPAPVFDLDRRLPSGHYVLALTGDAPDFHWMPEADHRFTVDLRSTSSDGTTPVGPARIALDRFPLLDIVIDSSGGSDALDTVEKVIRTIEPLPSGGAAQLCAASLPTASASAADLPASAAAPTVAYDELPAASGGEITIGDRSVEIDRPAGGTAPTQAATVVACRDGLEPVVATTGALAPNTETTIPLTVNPATTVRLHWDDHGASRSDHTDGITVQLGDDELISAGGGLYRTGRPAPGAAFSNGDADPTNDIVVSVPSGTYPGYAPPDLAGVTVTGAASNAIELPTRRAVLEVPVFQRVGTPFDDLVVVLTSTVDGSEVQAAVAGPCVDLPAGAPRVTQCDAVVTDPAAPPTDPGIRRGSYSIRVEGTTGADAVFAVNAGTFDLTPDKAENARLDDALHVVRRPELVVDVVDQAGADIPLGAAEAPIPVTVEQAGTTQTASKTGPGPVRFHVDPTDLVAHAAALASVAPEPDPAGQGAVPLEPTDPTVVDGEPIDVRVDLSGDDRFEYVDPADDPITVTDTTSLSPVVIRLLRYSTVDVAVRGDLRADPAENPLLPGATVTLEADVAGGSFDGVIGEYTSDHDPTTGTTTWLPLTLSGGSAELSTLELGDPTANLRVRKLRLPGCPPGCTATFTLTAEHPDFETPATATLSLTQGEATSTSLTVGDPRAREVSGVFETAEGRKLVNTTVCVTATPAAGSNAAVVEAEHSFGFDRGDQEWALGLAPRTDYTISATAQSCDGSGAAGNYTLVATLQVNGNAGSTGAGPVTGLRLQFAAGGATVTGRLHVKHPSAPDAAASPFTGCGSQCPTIELFAAADTGFESPLGAPAAYDPATGTFTLRDDDGERVLPLESPPGTFTDQEYVLRVTSPDLVTTVHPIGTLVENQPTALAAATDPLTTEVRVYAVDLLAEAGGTAQPGIDLRLQRTTAADALSPYMDTVECTTQGGSGSLGTCPDVLLVPGSYAVTGPAGGTIISVADDDADDPAGVVSLDLDHPAPQPRSSRTITVNLGFDIDVTVESTTDLIAVQGATVTFTPGNLTCTTGAAGTCTVQGASNRAYTVTVGGLVVTGGGSFTVDPTTDNAHSVAVNQPTMAFTGSNGTIVSVTTTATQTCTVSGGSCSIQLGSGVKADTVLTAVASRNEQASTTTFQWRSSRTVALAPLVDRTREVRVVDSAGTGIAGAEVSFAPTGGTGGSTKQCFTNGAGQCTLSGLRAGSYGISIGQIAGVAPSATTISLPPTGPSPITITASQPTVTFTGMAQGTVVSLSGSTATGTCNANASGTCQISLGASVPAAGTVTATASRAGQASVTTFSWGTGRSVAVEALVSRTRTVQLQPGDGDTTVGSRQVTFSPDSAGGSAISCTTSGTGACILSGLHAGSYDITVAGGTVAPGSATISAAPTGPPIEVTYTAD